MSRLNKAEWLNEVLKKDFVNDPQLSDARAFVGELKSIAEREANG